MNPYQNTTDYTSNPFSGMSSTPAIVSTTVINDQDTMMKQDQYISHSVSSLFGTSSNMAKPTTFK